MFNQCKEIHNYVKKINIFLTLRREDAARISTGYFKTPMYLQTF